MNENLLQSSSYTTATSLLSEDSFYELVQAKHGVFLANRHDIYIGNSLIQYGEYSESEWELLNQVIPEGGIVIEVGAHIGALTIPICKKVGPRGKVLAFEPQPIIFQNLCANLSLNTQFNTYAFNKACGSAKSNIKIPDIDYGKEGNYGGAQLEWFTDNKTGQDVEITTIDSYNIQQLNLLKLDVEGMELEALKGAQNTIERCKPIIYAENHFDNSAKDVVSFLLDLDYNIWQHHARLYNEKNYFQNSNNLYSTTTSLNIFCVPKNINTTIDLPQIKNADDLSIGMP